MNPSTTALFDLVRPLRGSDWVRRTAFAGALLGTALAASAADVQPRSIVFEFDSAGRLAGSGLIARHAAGKAPASRWKEPGLLHAEALPAASPLTGAFSRLDSGHRDAAFQFSAAGALADERLVLRSRLHLTRQSQGAGLRLSRANPYQAFPEFALAYRLRHDLAIGAEYRFRPDNRNPAGPFGAQPRDGAWKDVFLAWSPTSQVSLTASYVDLGRLTPALGGGRQIGRYLAAEFWY